ncbi:hypothetical protein VF09_37130 [Nostoc linckia z9]|nr:hypothetical protein VF09_37130 [Nostoc linckia z9]
MRDRRDEAGKEGRAKALKPPRDLADFAARWTEYRAAALRIENNAALGKDDRLVLTWLIQLADRAGPRDLV